MDRAADYAWHEGQPAHTHDYLWPQLKELVKGTMPSGRILEIGCGNGATAGQLAALGYDVTAIDPSEPGIAAAQRAYPRARFALGSVYHDLSPYGQFPLVLSLEVIEHCMWTRAFAKNIYKRVAPGGVAIISTPYHGYAKNLVLALTGKMAGHLDPLWDGGHIKFFTENSLRTALLDAGFTRTHITRAGRVRPLAKSMIAVAHR
jgi:2-polyprenyl-6-hydroxyphenyl methylase/3-demethylubiquinone-9 3-methyltransferase